MLPPIATRNSSIAPVRTCCGLVPIERSPRLYLIHTSFHSVTFSVFHCLLKFRTNIGLAGSPCDFGAAARLQNRRPEGPLGFQRPFDSRELAVGHSGPDTHWTPRAARGALSAHFTWQRRPLSSPRRLGRVLALSSPPVSGEESREILC